MPIEDTHIKGLHIYNILTEGNEKSCRTLIFCDGGATNFSAVKLHYKDSTCSV